MLHDHTVCTQIMKILRSRTACSRPTRACTRTHARASSTQQDAVLQPPVNAQASQQPGAWASTQTHRRHQRHSKPVTEQAHNAAPLELEQSRPFASITQHGASRSVANNKQESQVSQQATFSAPLPAWRQAISPSVPSVQPTIGKRHNLEHAALARRQGTKDKHLASSTHCPGSAPRQVSRQA